MEFLVISESKLKIIMTPDDAKKYEFSPALANYDSPDARKILWRIIDEATDTVGFDPKGDKILIQLYPSRDGGAEIFVTKLGALKSYAAKLVSHSENVTMLSREMNLYLFSGLEPLLRTARLISRNSSPKSDVYEAPSGHFFLAIEERGGVEGGEYSVISEFSEKCPSELIPYVKEHFKAIHPGSAIEKIAADGIGRFNFE